VKRGELYRVSHPSAKDSRKHRVFVIVGRQVVLDSRLSTVVCAPIYSSHDGLSTQVLVGINEGLKHDSSIHCDELISLQKTVLTNYVGALSLSKHDALNQALRLALDLPELLRG